MTLCPCHHKEQDSKTKAQLDALWSWGWTQSSAHFGALLSIQRKIKTWNQSLTSQNHSLNNTAAEDNPGVKKSVKDPSVHNLPSATGQNLFLRVTSSSFISFPYWHTLRLLPPKPTSAAPSYISHSETFTCSCLALKGDCTGRVCQETMALFSLLLTEFIMGWNTLCEAEQMSAAQTPVETINLEHIVWILNSSCRKAAPAA